LDVSIEASPETAKGFLDSVRSAVDALIEDAKRLEERLSFCEHVAGRR
jgi:cell division septum initiation protein DivIVA